MFSTPHRPTPFQLTRLLAMGLLATSLFADSAAAQNWAAAMVNKTSHNFGVVARGADVEYRFAFKNTFKEDIVLENVKSSCGCTKPSIENGRLKTYETGYVVAKFNTRTFTGLHGATLTVRLAFVDASGVRRTGRVQLRVDGDIRGDLVFQPGSINFEGAEQGTPMQKSVSITYAGQQSWRIEDVRSTSSDFEVELTERQRQHRRVAYDLTVKLKESAAPGPIKQQIILVTNNARYPQVPLEITGSVRPQLSIAPTTLALGEVTVGESVQKRLIVRGKKPFRITAIECGGDGCFDFPGMTNDATKEAADRHLVQVVFTPKAAGVVKRELQVRTDLGENFTASCTAYATVVATSPAAESATATPAAASNPRDTVDQLAQE